MSVFEDSGIPWNDLIYINKSCWFWTVMVVKGCLEQITLSRLHYINWGKDPALATFFSVEISVFSSLFSFKNFFPWKKDCKKYLLIKKFIFLLFPKPLIFTPLLKTLIELQYVSLNVHVSSVYSSVAFSKLSILFNQHGDPERGHYPHFQSP